jgi:hypothetical protein
MGIDLPNPIDLNFVNTALSTGVGMPDVFL